MKKIFVIVIIFICFLSGCSIFSKSLSENGKIGKEYAESLGYEVISYTGDSHHQFSKLDLGSYPNMQLWAVQSIDPDPYINKRIDTVNFIVKNHPLDNKYNMGKTYLTLFLYKGKVIGGWSFPIAKTNDLSGAPYSIDGKTAEEVKGDFHQWLKNWEEKYGMYY